jgi:hypothetical protein
VLTFERERATFGHVALPAAWRNNPEKLNQHDHSSKPYMYIHLSTVNP